MFILSKFEGSLPIPAAKGISSAGLNIKQLWRRAWMKSILGEGMYQIGPSWEQNVLIPEMAINFAYSQVMWGDGTFNMVSKNVRKVSSICWVFNSAYRHLFPRESPAPMPYNIVEDCSAQDYASPISDLVILPNYHLFQTVSRAIACVHQRSQEERGLWRIKICPTCGTIKELWLRHIVYSQQLSGK